MNIKKTVIIGILAAIICILAPLSVPAGAIPISLSTFAVYIVSCTVPKKYSVPAVAVYILLGAVGLPVFSSFTGGIQSLAGYTGGYIIGYIPCTFLIGLFTDKYPDRKIVYPLSLIAGTVMCYLFGTLWYMHKAEIGFVNAAAVCILPFIVGDIIKIAVASATGITLKTRLRKFISE